MKICETPKINGLIRVDSKKVQGIAFATSYTGSSSAINKSKIKWIYKKIIVTVPTINNIIGPNEICIIVSETAGNIIVCTVAKNDVVTTS